MAFTGRNAEGSALFLGQPGQLTRAISQGAPTSNGPLTYLSNGRPSLASDGSAAIEGASRERAMILGVRAGEPFVVVSEGDRVKGEHRLSGLADPTEINSGRLFVEAADENQRNGAYSFSFSAHGDLGGAMLLSREIEVFPSSLTLAPTGRYTFLSLSRQGNRGSAATPVVSDDATSL
ncbi:MAG: hypothetical protein JO121_17980 [Deltaproteobacteria bacterium]|nr:hypothetical protein [Deltaproteobacteria bacterium]